MKVRRLCICFQTHLRHCVLHHLLVRHITLVTHEQLVHTLRGVAVDLLQPLLDVVEAVHVGDIVDDADAVRAAVVRRGDGAETLLARGIPLLYIPQISSNRLRLRLEDNRGEVGRTICSFTVLPSSSMVRILKSTPMVEM